MVTVVHNVPVDFSQLLFMLFDIVYCLFCDDNCSDYENVIVI